MPGLRTPSSAYRQGSYLLRPKIEWALAGFLSLVTFALYAGIMAYQPALAPIVWMLLISGLTVAMMLLAKGFFLWRYQRQLQHKRTYVMPTQRLKSHPKHVFLGLGFLWQPRHTERLRDRDQAKKKRAFCNTMSGDTALHGVGVRQEKPIYWPTHERSGHCVVLGTTGVGKTRLAELLIAQDILRGDTVIVIDPKGDNELYQMMQTMAKKAGRPSKLHRLHLGFPEQSIPYNPIGRFNQLSEVASRLTQPLPDSGDSAAFKAFAWQFAYLVTLCMVFLERTPTYEAIDYYLSRREALLLAVCQKNQPDLDSWIADYQSKHTERHQKKQPTRMQALLAWVEEQGIAHETPFKDLLPFCRYEAAYYDKLSATIKPLLKKLTSGALGELLSPDSDTPALNWQTVIEEKQIIYVGLSTLTNPAVAAAVGNALLADLVSVAGARYNQAARHPLDTQHICLHLDEFNDIIGDECVPLLNKARGAGFQVCAYTQTWSDVEARLKSRAKADQVAGNFNTWIVLRLKDKATADKVLAGLPTMLYAPPTGSSDNKHHPLVNTIPLLTPADLFSLPRGEAFALMPGGALIKLRLPLLH